MSKTHELKILSEYFWAILEGKKRLKLGRMTEISKLEIT